MASPGEQASVFRRKPVAQHSYDDRSSFGHSGHSHDGPSRPRTAGGIGAGARHGYGHEHGPRVGAGAEVGIGPHPSSFGRHHLQGSSHVPMPPMPPPPPYEAISPRPPNPPLCFVRSTTDLTPGAGAPPSRPMTAGGRRPQLGVRTALVEPGEALPSSSRVNFIVDGGGYLSPETPASSTVPPMQMPAQQHQHRYQEMRRVKSSSALSATIATAGGSRPGSAWDGSSIGGGSQQHEYTESRPKTPSSSTSSPNLFKSALGEAHYFATGLVSHPVESTRHHSVIRHCHALVWYRGPSTSITVTVLSDQPLPADRTLWLQDRGYSGATGMALKVLVGATGGWLDVTPTTRAAATDLGEAEERAIQRDLKRFGKRATGKQKGHVARETYVVRIPAAAADGYFRLVLCSGSGSEGKKKSVLCGSPVFRVASTSTDAAVVRGASLGTMPLELGVKVASAVGQRVARTYAGAAGAVVQGRARRVVAATTSGAVRRAGATAYRGYQAAGVGDAVDERWREGRRRVGYAPLVGGQGGAVVAASEEEEELGYAGAIGSDDGPEEPFPLKFDARIVPWGGSRNQTTMTTAAEHGVPETAATTAMRLGDVSETVRMRLGGVFVAWVRLGASGPAADWREAVVTIAPLPKSAPGVVMRNDVVAHVLRCHQDEDGARREGAAPGSRVKVLLMGYLGPAGITTANSTSPGAGPGQTAEEEAMMLRAEQLSRDAAVAAASLSRPRWAAGPTHARLGEASAARGASERLDEVAERAARQLGRVPLHWVGVRTEAAALRDEAFGRGGMWVPR